MSTKPAYTKASQSLSFDRQIGYSRQSRHIPAPSAGNQTNETQSQQRGGRGDSGHNVTPRVFVQPPSGSEDESGDLYSAKHNGGKKQNVEQFHESLSPSRQSLQPESNLGDYSEPETGSDVDNTSPHRDMYHGRRPPTPPHPKGPSDPAAVVHEYQWKDDDDQEETVYSQPALSRWNNESQPSLDLPARREKKGLAGERQTRTFELYKWTDAKRE
jgi:hypothetical protein